VTTTVKLNKNATTINDAFGVTEKRLAELGESINAVRAGFKTHMDALEYFKTLAANDQEFAVLLLYYKMA
jgi:uncharacterized 2Fe-2S/4Fe-4S cluster protein (DUF4445 family)